MKHNIIPFLAIGAALAFSCTKDIDPIPDDQKTPIEFSVNGDGITQTKAGFTEAATRVIARFQSDENGTTNVKYAKAVLTASKDAVGGAAGYSSVDYVSSDQKKYWDDAFGRKGQISVYAVAIPNSIDQTKLAESLVAGGSSWAAEAAPDNTITWSVATDQSGNPLAAEDLVYSNNIQDGGSYGRYTYDYTANSYPSATGVAASHENGRLVFTQAPGADPSDAGHFDKGHLIFNHSLSRLTVTLVEGDGFDGVKTSATDFNFKTGTNIQLMDMNTAGKLDLKAGSWSNISSSDITRMAPSGDHYGANGTYASQMLPDYKFYENGTDNVMQFVIDDNTYYVTQKQVFAALESEAANDDLKKSDATGNYYQMEQGKNYVLTITVKKTGIESLSATLAPWVEVSGSTSVNNAHLSFSMSASGQACDKDIDLYRLADDNAGYDADNYDFSYEGKNWFGNYLTGDAYKTTLLHADLADGKWSTPWYFESNKTYYHFRTVNEGTAVLANDADAPDYFEIAGSATADPHWGAPMKPKAGVAYLKYDETKGYEDFLYPAIGATESTIAIQELHMMSNINVVLETSTDDGKVAFAVGEDKTIVKITRISKNGTVEMGRGVVTAATGSADIGEHTMATPADYWATANVKTKPYTFSVVPQVLARGTDDEDYVGIFIQTPDSNQYYVVKALSDITADTVSDQRNQTKDAKIQRWYPGHSYTYTIKVTKTGIQAITATVADWVTVSGSTDINLED